MMQIDPELLALRHAERPGCRFVGFREIAIPIFFMNLRAVIIRERSLPTADEFVLRCIQAGISTLDDCADFLGLSTSLVEHRIVELRTKELVELDHQAKPARLTLTAAGAVTARQLSLRELREETLSRIAVHGWTRRAIAYSEAETLAPIEADRAGLLKLRPVPSRHPEAIEIDARELTALLPTRKERGSNAVTEVLAVRAVLKGVKTRYLSALMMQWQSNAGGKPQIGFVVDGRLDEGLERCFGAMRGSEVFADLFAGDAKTAEQLVDETLPHQIRERVRRSLVSEREARLISQTSLELEAERVATELPAPDPERPDTRLVQAEQIRQRDARLQELEQKIKQQELALGKRPRPIWTSEIKHLFAKAFQNAKERLVVVSAFINDDVVDAAFITAAKAAVRRGADLYFVVGDENMAQGDNDRKRAARDRGLASLEQLWKQHPDKVRVAFRNHHAKILVCDAQFAVAGSFNFLSFRGDRGKVRDEHSILLSDPSDISVLADDVMQRYFT